MGFALRCRARESTRVQHRRREAPTEQFLEPLSRIHQRIDVESVRHAGAPQRIREILGRDVPGRSRGERTSADPAEAAAGLAEFRRALLAERVVADPGSLGFVLGGSGNGEQIAANKVPGARCALAWSVETAKLAREHNNAQLVGIGGRMHSPEEILAIADAFVGQAWSEEPRHQRRIDILAEYESGHEAPALPAEPKSL